MSCELCGSDATTATLYDFTINETPEGVMIVTKADGDEIHICLTCAAMVRDAIDGFLNGTPVSTMVQ